MVQFVNLKEFQAKAEAVLRRLGRSDVILTVHGKPKAVLHRVSERDLTWEEPFTDQELDRLEHLARERSAVYHTASAAKAHLRRLARK